MATKKRSDKIILQKKNDKARELILERFWMTLPEEDLEGYAHPERIEQSYQRAIKKHPPKM